MKKRILISTMLLALFTSACANNVNAKDDQTNHQPSSVVATSHNDVNQYTINFVNNDGFTPVCEPIQVEEGTTPVYPGQTSSLVPAIKSDDYQYTFKEWVPSITPAYCNTTYVATYTSTIKQQFTVKWYDDPDQDPIKTLTNVNYNSVPDNPPAPDHTSEGRVFVGWKDSNGNDPHLITSDTNYYAQYVNDPAKQGFTITINCVSCTVKDEYGSYYVNYSKHFSTALSQDLVYEFALNNSSHDYPYELTTSTDVNYSYNSDTGKLIIDKNINKDVTFSAHAISAALHADFAYDSTLSESDRTVGINILKKYIGNIVIDWGDGTPIEKFNQENVIKTHTYEADVSQTFTIKLFQCAAYNFLNGTDYDSSDLIADGNKRIKYVHGYKLSGIDAPCDNQFAKLEGLEQADLSYNFGSIGDNAFRGTAISYFALPIEECDLIGDNAFADCPNLKTLYMPKYAGVHGVGANILSSNTTVYCEANEQSESFDANWNVVNSLRRPVYWGFDYLEEDDTFEYVHYYYNETTRLNRYVAIKNYKKNDSEVTLPAIHQSDTMVQVSTIGNSAFKDKTALTKVTFPAPDETYNNSPWIIEDNAFSGCSNLTTVDMSKVTKVPQLGEHVFDGAGLSNSRSIIVPDELYDQFVADPTWEKYVRFIRIPLNITIDSTNLAITCSVIPNPGDDVTFTVKPNIAHSTYQLPTSGFNATITDNFGTVTTIPIVVTNNVGTFTISTTTETTSVTISADVFKLSFDANGGYFVVGEDKLPTLDKYYPKDAMTTVETPIRDDDAISSYTFADWYPTLPTKVTADGEFEAQYAQAMKDKFTIDWYLDKTATEPTETSEVSKLTMPVWAHPAPYKVSDGTNHYRFDKWLEKGTDEILHYAVMDTAYYANFLVDNQLSISFEGTFVVEAVSGKEEFTDPTTYNEGAGISYTFVSTSTGLPRLSATVTYKHSEEGTPTYTFDPLTGVLTFTGPIKDDVKIDIIAMEA